MQGTGEGLQKQDFECKYGIQDMGHGMKGMIWDAGTEHGIQMQNLGCSSGLRDR